jgi:hypothetical protein
VTDRRQPVDIARTRPAAQVVDRVARRGLHGFALGVLATVAVGCNEPRFLIPGPTLRGITIPLPPPSIVDEMLVTIDVEGGIPLGFQGPGTRAFLYEQGTGRGYFVYAEQQSFIISDVLVDIEDNCLESWFIDGVDDEESSVVNYKVVLGEGEACMDVSCSQMDQQGACLCLEKWTTGC